MRKVEEQQDWPVLTEVLLAYELFRLEDAADRTGIGTSLGWAVPGTLDHHMVWRTEKSSENSFALSFLIRDAFGGVATQIGEATA